MRRHLVALLGAFVTAGCGGSTPTSPFPIDAERLTMRIQTSHFQIFGGTSSPDATLRSAVDGLEGEYARILSDLGVSTHPVVTVRIFHDPTSYYNELTRYFGTRYQSTGYITGPTELRLLAGGNLTINAVHEFAHAVSLGVNPRFGNNPRWFWETVALYESGEFVHPRLIESVARGNFPSLQQLNADVNADTQIYQLGFVLAEFIVSQWGRPAFLRLIQTNADIDGVLGMSTADFEAAWQSFVRRRYLS